MEAPSPETVFPGMRYPWNPGSRESGFPGIWAPWNPGSLESGSSGIRAPWNPGSLESGSLESGIPGIRVLPLVYAAGVALGLMGPGPWRITPGTGAYPDESSFYAGSRHQNP